MSPIAVDALPNKRFFNAEELAEYTEQRPEFIKAAMRRGLIAHVDFGPKKHMIPRAEVERILQSGF